MIAIIGAGISGLALAWELQKRGVSYRLFEASDEAGGVIRSRREGPYLREIGPNSLLVDQKLLAYLDDLGLTADIRFSKPVSKARYVYRNGQYRKLPSGPISLLFGGYFGWNTLKALWNERNNPTTSPKGETLTEFFRRRFSQEIVDYALTPFVTGIYAGDPAKLLVAETFPSLVQYEKEYGSVLRGFMKNAGGVRKQTISFRNGMQMLPNAIAAKLTDVSLNDPVESLCKTDLGWHLNTRSGSYQASAVVLAADTKASARLLQGAFPDVAAALEGIDYPPMTAVHTVYKRADVAHPLDGFGGLNPKVETRFCAGHIWSSSTFEDRCPPDEVMLTTFVGGRLSAQNATMPEEIILRNVRQEHQQAFGVSGKPIRQWLARWERAIPQYDAAYVAAKQYIPMLQAEHIFVCANWLGGISLPDGIKKAEELSEQLTTVQRHKVAK